MPILAKGDDIRSGTKANAVTGGFNGLIVKVPVARSQCKINKSM